MSDRGREKQKERGREGERGRKKSKNNTERSENEPSPFQLAAPKKCIPTVTNVDRVSAPERL